MVEKQISNLRMAAWELSTEECLKVVKDIYRKIGCKDYNLLFSSGEYKKTAAKL